jgi:glyoxylase-like metal-dependent hydrolase (beta-lactamase superfamily II)
VKVHALPAGPIQTNAYLLTDAQRGEAVLIDAPGGIWGQVGPILKREGCRLTLLLLTHGHWDHTQGAAEVVHRSDARVFAHADDRVLFETPEFMKPLLPPGIELKAVRVDRWLLDGESFEALGDTVRVGHVPGHCPGSLSFYFPGAGAVFPGDALFRGSVGRTDLPGGSFEQLERSIRTRLYTLPDGTVVYPGHGAPTTVGEEKAHNPHVGA